MTPEGHAQARSKVFGEVAERRDGRFTDLRAVRFRQERRYDTDHYLRYLASLSAYRVLPDVSREQALAEARSLLDAHGGGIDVHQVTDVFLARAR
ncbi:MULTISPECIES: hypothetical protein [unclassified Streptomyces]|uniref:hypothetical protein n=1 Tax=unclassified Streptomyces TaxID=2593676 RepID=UPI0037F67344